MNNLQIISACVLNSQHLVVKKGENFRQMKRDKNLTLTDWLNVLYKELEIDYPKFYKMDNLSKTGFLASEYLLDNELITKEQMHPDGSIMMANSVSSLDTDKKFAQTIAKNDDFFPSPAIFVYTLPNLVAAEIAIRQRFTGNTTFWVAPALNTGIMQNMVLYAFSHSQTQQLIWAWMEYCQEILDIKMLYIKKIDKQCMNFTKLTPEIFNFLEI
ncbi:MAG: hypothetical protein LBR36_09185 [Bacteroidales bacterium]|jgi:hypothetical protein|nr:hypothetical protein [Bacteroidales bacterium]